MIGQVCGFIKTTWIFLFVRLVASAVVGLIYILFAAAVQYMYVEILGETTFNYVIGGILSMIAGAFVMHYVGNLIFMFIRGWHVAAIAFSSQIEKRNLPALEVGMTVFRKHFTSFALIYGVSLLVRKFAKKGVSSLWKLLEDVPYLGSLESVAKIPIVVKIGVDILDTAFDGIVFYVVKYTKPGMSDDATAIPTALKRYIYALPSIMLTSLSTFVLFYAIPRALRWSIVVGVLLNNGIVAGILINVLLYPMFYVLERAIFEPLETMSLLACYSARCTEEPESDDNRFKSFIDSVLDAAGFSEFISGSADSEKGTSSDTIAEEERSHDLASSGGSKSQDGRKESSTVSKSYNFGLSDKIDDDEEIDVAPVFDGSTFRTPASASDYMSRDEVVENASVSTLPLTEDDEISQHTGGRCGSGSSVKPPMSMKDIISAYRTSDYSDTGEEGEDTQNPPIGDILGIVSKLTPEMFERLDAPMSGADSDDNRDNYGALGGSDIDFQ